MAGCVTAAVLCCYSMILTACITPAIARKTDRVGIRTYLPSGTLKSRGSSSDKPPSFLHASLLKDRGNTESRLPEPLLQTAMTYYQTLPDAVDPEELMAKLRPQFDPKWMSVAQPYEEPHSVETEPPSVVYDPDLLADLRELNFSYVNDDDVIVSMKPQWQKAVEKWLLQKSSCPVHYQWDDVGPFFWPRWIKKGSCSNEKACSWPPGMHCVPSPRPMTVRILRWHCRPRRMRSNPQKRNDPPREQRKNRKRKQNKNRQPFRVKCRWRKVRYPITTQCFCAC